ncbi:MAG TPA: carbohydrate ABC transporter permease [Candidatus Limnocylindrales bacterium]|nr:carbohydrate ABC transporter permease [Candidatus Limnocylindrales bacterium]
MSAISASVGDPRRALRRGALYLTLVSLAILFLVPLYVVVAGSLKSFEEVTTSSIWALPGEPSLEAFTDSLQPPLINSGGIASGLVNSLTMTIPAVILSALWGSVTGYALSMWRFRGSELLFALILFGLFIPYQAILIPLLTTLQLLKLFDSLAGLSLTHVIFGLPITTLIFRNFYAAIPTELLDAARVDGAGFWQVYRRIVLPLSVPAFVVVGIWQFTSIWNEFLFAVSLTSSPDTQPVTVSLQNLAGSFAAQYNVQLAGALIAAVPTLLVYIFLGRFFVRGLLAGSLKG